MLVGVRALTHQVYGLLSANVRWLWPRCCVVFGTVGTSRWLFGRVNLFNRQRSKLARDIALIPCLNKQNSSQEKTLRKKKKPVRAISRISPTWSVFSLIFSASFFWMANLDYHWPCRLVGHLCAVFKCSFFAKTQTVWGDAILSLCRHQLFDVSLVIWP